MPAQGIVLIGDSAGSNLLLGMLHRLKAAGDSLPCCLAVMSPVVDLTLSSESLVENGARDCIFTLAAILAFRRLYATPDVFLDPAVSPLFGLVVDAADPTDVPAVRTASSRSISVLPA